MSAGHPALAAVVFDLDGTLIDSRQDLATAVNLVRDDLGLRPLSVAEIVPMVGEGARKLVSRAVKREVGDEGLEATFTAFLDHYRQVCVQTTRPYPGIPHMLRQLGRRFPLGLLTNKPEETTRLILAHLNLLGHFRDVVAGDTLETRKPDPQGLYHLVSRLAVEVEQTVLVGDSAVDAQTARAAGCRLLLVEWGFTDPSQIWNLEAEAQFATADQLAHFLLSM